MLELLQLSSRAGVPALLEGRAGAYVGDGVVVGAGDEQQRARPWLPVPTFACEGREKLAAAASNSGRARRGNRPLIEQVSGLFVRERVADSRSQLAALAGFLVRRGAARCCPISVKLVPGQGFDLRRPDSMRQSRRWWCLTESGPVVTNSPGVSLNLVRDHGTPVPPRRTGVQPDVRARRNPRRLCCAAPEGSGGARRRRTFPGPANRARSGAGSVRRPAGRWLRQSSGHPAGLASLSHGNLPSAGRSPGRAAAAGANAGRCDRRLRRSSRSRRGRIGAPGEDAACELAVWRGGC